MTKTEDSIHIRLVVTSNLCHLNNDMIVNDMKRLESLTKERSVGGERKKKHQIYGISDNHFLYESWDRWLEELLQSQTKEKNRSTTTSKKILIF